MTVLAKKNVNAIRYGRMLTRVLPAVIKTERENKRMLEEIWKLMSKGERNLSVEETVLLELLSKLVEDFEKEHHPISDAPPHQVLSFLMEQRGLRQRDLLPIFGSRGVISEVLAGKRTVSKSQAEKLAECLHVSPAVFI